MPTDSIPLALKRPLKPSPILGAPPLTAATPTEGIWFTNTPAKRVNGRWWYKATRARANKEP